MITPEDRKQIVLDHADAGASIQQICAASGLHPSRVYALLREHRPDRPRQTRKRNSVVPQQIVALRAIGTKPARIARLLSVTPQYVYKVLKETVDNPPVQGQ